MKWLDFEAKGHGHSICARTHFTVEASLSQPKICP